MKDCLTAWDACIASLPPEKRAAAERAFQDIIEGGQDGLFPKVFLLLEAHAAYTNTIPARITEAGAQSIALMRQVVEAHSTNPALSKEDMERLLTAIRQADGVEVSRAMKSKIEETAMDVKRLNRQVSRLRNLRLSVGIILFILVGLVSYGAYWLGANWELIGTVNKIQRTGLQVVVNYGEHSVQVEVNGPNPQGTLLPGKDGKAIGVRAQFPTQ